MANYIYIIIIVILFLLAFSDLIIGVSNDAVNFLTPAIGSKSAKFHVIMIMASIGILLGAISSNGMMEVARKGIFNPQMLTFQEIIFLFSAVMLSDILLLDFFNTLGLPTSTTVSVVFDLLGATVGIAILKVAANGGSVAAYINSSKALAIISGILLSVVVAFIVGSVIQWFARLLFTFNLKKTYKKFASLWTGLAMAVIVYFLFSKGLKNSSISDTKIIQWISQHALTVFIINFVLWTVIAQIVVMFTKYNVLKFTVLVGTFALAMAFAGNDLVNFIGVPLAGFSSFQLWHHSGIDASKFTMEALAGDIKVNPLFLIASAFVMIVTLFTSKKAKTVIETSVNLSRQTSGYERFESTQVSRALVRIAINIGEFFSNITPPRIKETIEKRFKIEKPQIQDDNAPAFDLLRASVNLVVSSLLITIATLYKLPLSTTYVTFMVAMGSSLSDRAWGRESAVFRVTGVISVITGWFLTALIAFTIAMTISIILFKFKFIALVLFTILAGFIIYRSRIVHRKKEEKKMAEIQEEKENISEIKKDFVESVTKRFVKELNLILLYFETLHNSFFTQNRKEIKNALKLAEQIKSNAKKLKKNIYNTVKNLEKDNLISIQYYVQMIDALREISNATVFLAERMFEHINNNHDMFDKETIKDIEKIKDDLYNYILESKIIIEYYDNGEKLNEIREFKNNLLVEIEKQKNKVLLEIKEGKFDIINSNLYLNILAEYKNLVLFFVRIVKAHQRLSHGKKKLNE